MKKLVFMLMVIFSSCALAYSYNVSGEDDNSRSVEGTVDASSGSRSVSGEICYEDGSCVDFDGEWDGYGHISGETDDGVGVELDTD